MINEKLNRIEKEIQEIKRMTNTEYFKKVEEQCERVNNAFDYSYKLNKEYKDRIDKAIEYIKERTTDEDTGEYLEYSDMIDDEILLNILRGKEK